MSVTDSSIDAANLALLLARVGSEISDWADTAVLVEASGLSAAGPQASQGLQQLDALTQHLREISGFVLRLSAAVEDGVEISDDDIVRLGRPMGLSGLQSRLTAVPAPLNAIPSGEVELW